MIAPELDVDTTIVSFILFVVIAFFIRPPMKIILFALMGGVAFAVLNYISDMIAYWAGWWRFPFVSDRYPPLEFYIPVLFFYGAGIAGLIGWWLRSKFNSRSAIVFLALFPLLALVRISVEWIVKSGTLVAFRKDWVSVVAIYLDWLLLASITYLIVLGLEKITFSKTVWANRHNAAV